VLAAASEGRRSRHPGARWERAALRLGGSSGRCAVESR
jgi:hypothetical protein